MCLLIVYCVPGADSGDGEAAEVKAKTSPTGCLLSMRGGPLGADQVSHSGVVTWTLGLMAFSLIILGSLFPTATPAADRSFGSPANEF